MDSIPTRYTFPLGRITNSDNDYYITITDFVLNSMNGNNKAIVRKSETNLADLVTDAFLFIGKILDEDVEIALVNGGNIRGNLTEGKINHNNVITTLPFSSLVSITEVSGQSILDALEHGVRKYPELNGGFLHTAGLTYAIDPEIESSVVVDDSEPYNIFVEVSGKRRVHSVLVNGKPIDPKRTYKIIASSFITRDKGDGFVFPDATVIKSDFALPSDLLADYLIRLDRVSEEYKQPQERIVFKKTP
ncbi:hypothetical protein PIROE2DRAFT_67572, partial [Piromyces sp. E2]